MMTRAFVCWPALILAAAIFVGLVGECNAAAKEVAADKGDQKKDKGKERKRETVTGTVKDFDPATGALTIDVVRAKKKTAAGDRKLKVPKGTPVAVFEGGKRKDISLKEGWNEIKAGANVTVNLKGGQIMGVIVGTAPKKEVKWL